MKKLRITMDEDKFEYDDKGVLCFNCDECGWVAIEEHCVNCGYVDCECDEQEFVIDECEHYDTL